jgi:hypothetical protein
MGRGKPCSFVLPSLAVPPARAASLRSLVPGFSGVAEGPPVQLPIQVLCKAAPVKASPWQFGFLA